eukprot:scaffold400527_cov44-Prasinocladus_malaysianus.AAC.2
MNCSSQRSPQTPRLPLPRRCPPVISGAHSSSLSGRAPLAAYCAFYSGVPTCPRRPRGSTETTDSSRPP